MSENNQQLREIKIKLDRLMNDVDFIKNRMGTYLGANQALTYLADGSPIFINTDDSGCPINFLNGGLYEEDYYRVFQSFRRPGLPMLDIGANLGVYSLKMAGAGSGGAKIHAFEPIPKIRELFSRSVFINGYSERILIYPFAVSDKTSRAKLNIPSNHAGGASLQDSSDGIDVEAKRLDEFFPNEFICGIIKLDIEGHELQALRGMRKMLSRSPDAMVMFEKLSSNNVIDADIFEYFSSLDWTIYFIDGRRLAEVDLHTFINTKGYFVATTKKNVSCDGLDRDFFYIYAEDLNPLACELKDGLLKIEAQERAGSVIFHGPYWWLSRGYYRVTLEAQMNRSFSIEVCESFGYKVSEFIVSEKNMSVEFAVERDLQKFELVLRPLDDSLLKGVIKRIKIAKIG